VEGEETEREKEDTPKDWEYYYWLYMNNPDLYWEELSTGESSYGFSAALSYSETVLHQIFDPIGSNRTMLLVGAALENKAERARGGEPVDPWELLGLIGLAYVATGGGEFSPLNGPDDFMRGIRGEQDYFVRRREGGLSVYRGATEEQIRAGGIRGEIRRVSPDDVIELGLSVDKTPGKIESLAPYHYELVRGPGQTRGQFKAAIRQLRSRWR